MSAHVLRSLVTVPFIVCTYVRYIDIYSLPPASHRVRSHRVRRHRSRVCSGLRGFSHVGYLVSSSRLPQNLMLSYEPGYDAFHLGSIESPLNRSSTQHKKLLHLLCSIHSGHCKDQLDRGHCQRRLLEKKLSYEGGRGDIHKVSFLKDKRPSFFSWEMLFVVLY